MAGVSKKDIPQESAMMGDLWEMIKKYYIPEDGEEYWDSLMKDYHDLREKYPSELCKLLVLGYLEYLHEKHQAMKRIREQQGGQG